jgi:hypothetical protein
VLSVLARRRGGPGRAEAESGIIPGPLARRLSAKAVPIPDPPALVPERGASTLSGHSLQVTATVRNAQSGHSEIPSDAAKYGPGRAFTALGSGRDRRLQYARACPSDLNRGLVGWPEILRRGDVHDSRGSFARCRQGDASLSETPYCTISIATVEAHCKSGSCSYSQ